jgi:hypothetical protein
VRVPATAEGRLRHGSLRTTAALADRACSGNSADFHHRPAGATCAPDAAQICAGYAWDGVVNAWTTTVDRFPDQSRYRG